MSGLAELQRGFALAVRGDTGRIGGLGVAAAGLAPDRRVAVYRNHHRISLAAALAANFPTVFQVIGETAFPIIANDFVTAAPPREPCIGVYGAGFADFLAGDPRLAPLRYLADVARLDWACNTAEQAADVPAFAPEHLAALAGSGLADVRLAPHPSLTLLRSAYPLLRIRALARAADGAERVSLEEGGVDLAIWRCGARIECAALDGAAYRLVKGLAAGTPLGVAAEGLEPDQLAQALARIVVAGAFAAPRAG